VRGAATERGPCAPAGAVVGTRRACRCCLPTPYAAPLRHLGRSFGGVAEGMGIRLNKRPPNIAFTKKDKGGIAYRSLYPQPHLEEELVKAIW
jgi:ribosome-interacting GTPase 1